MDYSFVGWGFGDAIRICEHMKYAKIKIVVAFESLGSQVCENFNFIDKVIKVDEKRFYNLLADYPENNVFGSEIQDHEFNLEPTDLRLQHTTYNLKNFTAVQPATTLHKINVLKEKIPRNSVLFGSQKDKTYFKHNCLDLRGKLSVAESMYLVSQCQLAIGVESWLASLAGCLHIPTIMYCSHYHIYGEKWKRGWPTIDFRSL